mgnify:CR=1 FL=1
MCVAFGCTPDVALRQDWALVQAILDYRTAKAAIDLFNGGKEGAEELLKQPHLGAILVAMHRAQVGEDVTVGQMMDARRQTEMEADDG